MGNELYQNDSYINGLASFNKTESPKPMDYGQFVQYYEQTAVPKLVQGNPQLLTNKNTTFNISEISVKAADTWDIISKTISCLPAEAVPDKFKNIQQWIDVGISLKDLPFNVRDDVYLNGESPLQASLSQGLAFIGSAVAGIAAGAALVASYAIDPSIPLAYQEEVGRKVNELYTAIDDAIDSYFENGADYAKSLFIIWKDYATQTLDTTFEVFNDKDYANCVPEAFMLPGGQAGFLNSLMANQAKYNTLTTDMSKGEPDPIVINLGDQEGFDTKSLAESDAYFDTDQNGFAEKTGWVGTNSGILVRDVNGNGVIDGGAEVFGDSTILSNGNRAATGFDALRDLDSNGDGIISSEDAMYDTLRVWKDDGDGISEDGELKTLNELGIKSISLDSETVNATDGKGNTITRTSDVEFSDGTIRKAGEFLFDTNTIDTESASTYTGTFEISDEIKLLPYLDGISNIDDLHTAMAKDAVLLTLVQDYINETDASFDAYAA